MKNVLLNCRLVDVLEFWPVRGLKYNGINREAKKLCTLGHLYLLLLDFFIFYQRATEKAYSPNIFIFNTINKGMSL